MNSVIKYIVGCLIALTCIICISLSFQSGKDERKGILLRRIVVENSSEEGKRFMSESDVLKHLNTHFGNLIGKEMDKINLHHIEQSLDKNTAILKCHAYTAIDSTLHIQITERKPKVRFQRGNTGFYADENALLFPLQPNYSVWVPIVDGNFPIRYTEKLSPKEKKWLDDLFSLLDYMQSQKNWKERCNQIHIRHDGEIVLHFEGFQESFLIGDFHNLSNKFKKIEQYISTIRPVAEKQYKTVNVHYKGQIICK